MQDARNPWKSAVSWTSMHIYAPYLPVSAWTWTRKDGRMMNGWMTISLFRDFQCTANPSNATYKTDSPDSFGHRGKQRQAIRAERLEKRLRDQEISSRLSNQIRDSSFIFAYLCHLPSSKASHTLGLNWGMWCCIQIHHGPTISSTCHFEWRLDVSRSYICA